MMGKIGSISRLNFQIPVVTVKNQNKISLASFCIINKEKTVSFPYPTDCGVKVLSQCILEEQMD